MIYLLSDREKIDSIILGSHNLTLKEVGTTIGVSKSQVSYLVNKYTEHSTVRNLWRTIKPLAFNLQERENIINAVLNNRQITLKEPQLKMMYG